MRFLRTGSDVVRLMSIVIAALAIVTLFTATWPGFMDRPAHAQVSSTSERAQIDSARALREIADEMRRLREAVERCGR